MPEWERKGECNGCGWCCQFIGEVTILYPVVSPEAQDYCKVRGISLKEKDGKVEGQALTSLYFPCQYHDKDKLACKIYESRPEACRVFPSSPGQVVHTPCSYWFTRNTNGVEENVGGSGSPYPLEEKMPAKIINSMEIRQNPVP